MKNKATITAAAIMLTALLTASCGQNGTSGTTSAAAETSTAETSAASETTTAAEAQTETSSTAPAAKDTAAETDDGTSGELTEGYFQPGLYAAVKDGIIDSLYYFDSATEGRIENFDGIGGVPFTYEQNFDEVTFHLFSADDNTKMTVKTDEYAYPVGTFEEDGRTLTFSYLGETADQDVPFPENEAVSPFTIPGVYSGMIRGEFISFYIFDDETHGREMYLGGQGNSFTYKLTDNKIVFVPEDGTEVPMTLRTDDFFRPVGRYDGSGAVVSFNYVRGADPTKLVLAEAPQSEGDEPAHPFQYNDYGWEMTDASDTLMDMNAVAGRNNAFMLQLSKEAVQNGFESHFIFLDSDGNTIADHTVSADKVEDLGITPAPMLGGFDIVVYPVKLSDIIDKYGISLPDVARFYITDDPDTHCIQFVTIEQY